MATHGNKNNTKEYKERNWKITNHTEHGMEMIQEKKFKCWNVWEGLGMKQHCLLYILCSLLGILNHQGEEENKKRIEKKSWGSMQRNSKKG